MLELIAVYSPPMPAPVRKRNKAKLGKFHDNAVPRSGHVRCSKPCIKSVRALAPSGQPASRSRVRAARSSAANGLPDFCNDSHAVSKADAKVFVVSTSNVCFPRSLSIHIISLFSWTGASQPAKSRSSPLTLNTSPLSVMSASKMSTNGCWRLNPALL